MCVCALKDSLRGPRYNHGDESPTSMAFVIGSVGM